MSVATMVTKESKLLVENVQSFFRLSIAYFRRNNPAFIAYTNINMSIKNILTANKKLKVAKYRVNHLRYRLYQMEQLIQENNPHNRYSGGNINQLR